MKIDEPELKIIANFQQNSFHSELTILNYKAESTSQEVGSAL